VSVTATEALTLTGLNSRLTSSTSGDGNAGRVVVKAPLVSLKDQADIQARAMPDSQGNVPRGNAGEIEMQVGTLALSDRANISNSNGGQGQGGNVTIVATEALTLRDKDTRVTSNAHSSGHGGQIVVEAPSLSVTEGAGIRANADGSGNGGAILVQVGTLTLSGRDNITNIATSTTANTTTGRAGSVTVLATGAITLAGPRAEIASSTQGSGDGGQIVVKAPMVSLQEGASINASTAGAGRGGNVTVQVTKAITLLGDGTEVRARALEGSQGDAGDIRVQAGTVTLTGGTHNGIAISSSTDGAGRGGNVTVEANEAITLVGYSRLTSNAHSDGAGGRVVVKAPLMSLMGNFAGIRSQADGRGDAGEVEVQVGTLTLSGGATIGTSTTRATSEGRAGSVTVTATEAIMLAGQNTEIGSNTVGRGDAGRVSVSAPVLRLQEGASIRTGALQEIGSNAPPQGNAGDILVQVGTLTLSGGASILSSTAGAGQGGNITLQALRVGLTDTATISTESTGLGNAGNVTITTGDTFLISNSSVITRATQADGGNIQITAPTLVRLRTGAITAEVRGGVTTVGGNITIDPQFVLLQNSQIVANAFAGRGGNIRIQAQQGFLADPASTVSASSMLGINGQVAIQAPVTSISGAVAPLPQAFAQTAELLRSRCMERLRGGTVSRFVLGGRDGVPLEPGSLLLSPLVQGDQEGVVEKGKPERQNPDAQPGWDAQVQAQARGEWEVACARWMGKPGTPRTPQRSR
jgi:large exoprotein involved in heme utilization and adhesion